MDPIQRFSRCENMSASQDTAGQFVLYKAHLAAMQALEARVKWYKTGNTLLQEAVPFLDQESHTTESWYSRYDAWLATEPKETP